MIRVALVLASALALAACGGSGDAPADADTATGAPADEGVALVGETLDGESLSLEEFRGKPLFVNVWASW
jgi:hypothetical protein